MKKYHLHLIGEFYAITVYGKNKRDAINNYKKNWDINRMPNGYTIWES